MSNSIGFGKMKMSLSIGIGKRNQKPFKGRSVLNCTQKKKWLPVLAHFAQGKNRCMYVKFLSHWV